MRMEARVGARMEVVPPKRWLAPPDVGLLLLLAAISVGLHLWLVRHTFVTARDSLGFARLALNLESPAAADTAHPDGKPRTFIDVLKTAEHPPGYPVTVLAVSYGVRRCCPGPLPEQMLLSCQLASAAAGVLLVLPTYLLGRLLMGRFPGFAAALLFQVLPVPAHVTSDGLSEGLYLLAVSTALFFGVRAVRHRSTLYFLLCGATAGLGYLVRPEGLMVVLAVGGVVAGLGVLRRWPRDVAAGRLTALAVGVVLAASPYMLLIGGMSNKSTSKELLERLLGNKNPKAKLGSWDQGGIRHPALFAAWYDPTRDGNKAVWAGKAVAGEVWKAGYYVPCLLAVVGLGALRPRLVAEPETAVLPLLAVINVAVIYSLGLKIGYVSERHTLLIVLIVCHLAASVLGPVARVFAPSGGLLGGVSLLVALVASALPPTLRPLHENRLGHYHAGKYLAGVLNADDAVVDPFSWAEFYSGRSLYSVPPDPEHAATVYAVLENSKDNPHSRLPRLDLAKQFASPDRVAYYWPETGSAAVAKVVVYKTVVLRRPPHIRPLPLIK